MNEKWIKNKKREKKISKGAMLTFKYRLDNLFYIFVYSVGK